MWKLIHYVIYVTSTAAISDKGTVPALPTAIAVAATAVFYVTNLKDSVIHVILSNIETYSLCYLCYFYCRNLRQRNSPRIANRHRSNSYSCTLRYQSER